MGRRENQEKPSGEISRQTSPRQSLSSGQSRDKVAGDGQWNKDIRSSTKKEEKRRSLGCAMERWARGRNWAGVLDVKINLRDTADGKQEARLGADPKGSVQFSFEKLGAAQESGL